jgi:hypothetical protein
MDQVRLPDWRNLAGAVAILNEDHLEHIHDKVKLRDRTAAAALYQKLKFWSPNRVVGAHSDSHMAVSPTPWLLARVP